MFGLLSTSALKKGAEALAQASVQIADHGSVKCRCDLCVKVNSGQYTGGSFTGGCQTSYKERGQTGCPYLEITTVSAFHTSFLKSLFYKKVTATIAR